MFERVKLLMVKIVSWCFSIFPIKKNRVFFVSFFGKSYSDNPKAVSETMYDMFQRQFEYVWLLNDKDNRVPSYVKRCRRNSIKMWYYMATSKVWVSNFTMTKGLHKRKGQTYIQTWHGDKAFKKILLDIHDKPNKWYFETNHTDLMIVGSDYGEKQMRTAFHYDGDFLKVGCPRNDIFFKENKELKKRLRQMYACADGEKILLYAPTLRESCNLRKQPVALNLKKVLSVLENSTNSKWKILIRAHSANSNYGLDVETSDKIISATDYPDMNELLQIVDVLITDYSSCAGDFALSGKPILLYQDDLSDYINNSRELYFDMDDTPYYKFSNQDGLLAFLKGINSIDSVDNCKKILDFYHSAESGKASYAVAEYIYNLK